MLKTSKLEVRTLDLCPPCPQHTHAFCCPRLHPTGAPQQVQRPLQGVRSVGSSFGLCWASAAEASLLRSCRRFQGSTEVTERGGDTASPAHPCLLCPWRTGTLWACGALRLLPLPRSTSCPHLSQLSVPGKHLLPQTVSSPHSTLSLTVPAPPLSTLYLSHH